MRVPIAVLLLALAAPVDAQSLPGTSPMDFSAMTNRTLNNRIGNLSVKSTAQRGARQQAARPQPTLAAGPTLFSAAFTPGLPAGVQQQPPAPPALAYPRREATAKAVEQEFLGRLQRTDPAAARALATNLAQHDFGTIYDGMARSAGISANNVGDVMAAFLLFGWQVVNGREGAEDRTAQDAVRARVATLLAANPALKSAETRARVAEELKLLTVVMHSGWLDARKTGEQQRYARGLSDYFRGMTGTRLESLDLTSSGFVERRT
jgi:hypothetical protein